MNLIPHHRKSQGIIERTVKYIRYCEVLKISKLLVNYIYKITKYYRKNFSKISNNCVK